MRVNVNMKRLEHGGMTMTQAGEVTRWMMWATEHEAVTDKYQELLIEPLKGGGMQVSIVILDQGKYKWFAGSFVNQHGEELTIKA